LRRKKMENDDSLSPESDLDIKKLEERKLRLTKPRKIILEEVRKTNAHPTANELYMKVRKRLPKVSMGTVYRNLKLFKEIGLILELENAGAPGRFEEGSPDHSHFICEKCGKIFDVEDQINKAKEQKLAEKLSAIIAHHRAEFYGLCKECRSLEAQHRFETSL
jgi:Fe2+ or Zn2+ uptake regulation protein